MLPTTLGLCGVCIFLQHWRRLSQDPPRWNVQPSNFQQSLAIPHCRETWGRVLSDAHNQRFGDLRVPLFDHVDAISPTGPKSCHARPHRGRQAQPSQREWQLRHPLSGPRDSFHSQDCSHAPPHVGVMTDRERLGLIRVHCAQPEVRPGCSAHEQQKPTCLGILHQVSAMKQKILLR